MQLLLSSRTGMGSQECRKGVAVYAVWDGGVAVIKDLLSYTFK